MKLVPPPLLNGPAFGAVYGFVWIVQAEVEGSDPVVRFVVVQLPIPVSKSCVSTVGEGALALENRSTVSPAQIVAALALTVTPDGLGFMVTVTAAEGSDGQPRPDVTTTE